MSKPKLKPCPFCGGKASIKIAIKNDGSINYKVKFIECNNCGARTEENICDGYYDLYCSDEEIAELYNQRSNSND